ncbi:hypothetical protein P22_2187 [Propionispora sp. 2/2-37]|uniref:FliO/MopB family protein n=1 Tax=Propionispora sp. 2/2-37 TaxID=1677858 RepID=UPI0006C1A2C1|nr:flagellar biosynthetic protein FliO [Propionispora sp. 2/2-37]CUH96099.1 hypothetical protein P22_2187 [Propionispora sp. 2/2-37]
MMFRRTLFLLLLVCFVAAILPETVLAEDSSRAYLQYQDPKPPEVSWVSSVAYVFSLLITFAVVLLLAYFASRFVGQKMGKVSAASGGQVLRTIPLGGNRGIYVVEIAGKVLVLGVTDHAIALLQEITAEEEIAKLKNMSDAMPASQFETLLQKQLTSLQQMTHKFPGVFGSRQDNDRGKR